MTPAVTIISSDEVVDLAPVPIRRVSSSFILEQESWEWWSLKLLLNPFNFMKQSTWHLLDPCEHRLWRFALVAHELYYSVQLTLRHIWDSWYDIPRNMLRPFATISQVGVVAQHLSNLDLGWQFSFNVTHNDLFVLCKCCLLCQSANTVLISCLLTATAATRHQLGEETCHWTIIHQLVWRSASGSVWC